MIRTTCTVPANRNSSKNRVKLKALPSRGGVLIEFQSQVFTSNSRAISGLKLEFSERWYLGDIWVISGWYLDDIWMIFGWYLDDIWMISGWDVGDMWVISVWYLDDMWVIFFNNYIFNICYNVFTYRYKTV